MNALVAPPFPTNPSVGQIVNGWVWNGSAWVPAPPVVGQTVTSQVFKASGTYMPSPGLTTALVQCIGGGGSGGYVISLGTFSGAGGGGSGGRSIKACPAALVMGGVVVTVGTGNQAAIGAINSGGLTAGATSFGGLCVAYGGQNSNPFDHVNSPFYDGDAGDGAAVGIGDVMWPGSAGTRWTTCGNPSSSNALFAISGLGGVIVGGNQIVAPQFSATAPGGNGFANTGAGGGGAEVNGQPVGTQAQGGRGADGICIVLEFCWAQGGGGPPPGCAPVPITDGSCIGWGPWGGPC